MFMNPILQNHNSQKLEFLQQNQAKEIKIIKFKIYHNLIFNKEKKNPIILEYLELLIKDYKQQIQINLMNFLNLNLLYKLNF